MATRSALPAKLAFSVRPFGSIEVTLTVQLAIPGFALGIGVQTPLFDKISLVTGELRVIGASTLGSIAFALCLTAIAKADTTYTFTMNTSPLAGNGQFSLDFQFLDSTGLPADLNNNTVKLTGFAFGAGGSASGGGSTTGGASGSLASGVTLTDAAFFNELVAGFTPGSQLSFNIDTTNVLDSSGTPDLFTVAILDSHGNELPTAGFASEFLDVTLAGGASPQVSAFGSAPGGTFSLAAPVVQPATTMPAPEPSALWLLVSALMALGPAYSARRGILQPNLNARNR